MAFKRSAVRSRLSPPKPLKLLCFNGFSLFPRENLCACGGKVEETVIGDWAGDFTYNSTTIYTNGNSDMCIAAGHSVTTTLSVFKGGSVQIKIHSNETGFDVTANGTWEINDSVLVVTYTYGTEQTFSFAVDTDTTPNILKIQGSGVFFPATLNKK